MYYLFLLFRCPHIVSEFGDSGLGLAIYDILLTLLALAHFLAATFVDPGRYPKGIKFALVFVMRKKSVRRLFTIECNFSHFCWVL